MPTPSFAHPDQAFHAPSEVAEEVAAGAVARFPTGSGFVLADRTHVLTCLHVARELGRRGEIRTGVGTADERTIGVEVVATAPRLDLALYALAVPATDGFPLRATVPQEGEAVRVVGHPDGEPIRVSYGRVVRAEVLVNGVPGVGYDARTGWGSSGSVVLDQAGQAIAIHWAWDIDGRWHGGAVGVGLAVAAEQWPALAEHLPPTWPP